MKTRRIFKKFFAMTMSIVIMLGVIPIAVNAEQPSLNWLGEIVAFEPLADDISIQIVPYATELTDLSLPDFLNATVQYITSVEPDYNEDANLITEETSDEETDDANDDLTKQDELTDEQEDSNEELNDINGKTELFEESDDEPTEEAQSMDADMDSASIITYSLSFLLKILPVMKVHAASPQDVYSEQLELSEIEIPISVIWESMPEYDGEIPGEYVFIPMVDESYSINIELPTIRVIVLDESNDAIIIASFDELDEKILFQSYDIGEVTSQDDLILPNVLTGIDLKNNRFDVEGVTWECEPGFSPTESIDYPGYVFSAVLPQEYMLFDGGDPPPVIRVFIRDGFIGIAPRFTFPITVSNENELLNALTNGTSGRTITLINDIAIGSNWNPVNITNAIIGNFVLDGNGYNITIASVIANRQNKGLFGSISTGNMTIRNLGVSVTSQSGQVTDNLSTAQAGGLIGLVTGGTITIDRCFVTGNVRVDSYHGNIRNVYAGGFIGRNAGGAVTITNSYSRASIVGRAETPSLISFNNRHVSGGGFVGRQESGSLTITRSYAACSVNLASYQSPGDCHFGSFVGQGSGTVQNSYYSNTWTVANSSNSVKNNHHGTYLVAAELRDTPPSDLINAGMVRPYNASGTTNTNINGGYPILPMFHRVRGITSNNAIYTFANPTSTAQTLSGTVVRSSVGTWDIINIYGSDSLTFAANPIIISSTSTTTNPTYSTTVRPTTGALPGNYNFSLQTSGGRTINASASIGYFSLGNQTIAITAPVTGAAAQTTITAGTGYTGSISWSNMTDNIAHTGNFVGGKVYRATVTLTSTGTYQWPGTAPTIWVTGQTVQDRVVSGIGVGNTLTFNVTFAATVMPYALTMSNNPSGVVPGQQGAGSYAPNSMVNINAGTRDGYSFVNWASTPSVFFGNAWTPATFIYMPTGNVAITANWKLRYEANINPTQMTFPTVFSGYPTQTARQFTITNTGAESVTNLTAALGSTDFEISSSLSSTTIAPNGTATISIRPVTALAANTYTDTLTISGDNGINLFVPLNFEVTSISTYTATISPENVVFPAGIVGFNELSAQHFIITNTGTEQIENLSVSLGSLNYEISSPLSSTIMASGDTATVSVKPKTGLAANIYTDVLSVTGDNGINLSANLSFTVNETYTAEINPASMVIPMATMGYNTQATRSFSILNTGTAPLTNLTASLSTLNFEVSSPLTSTTIQPGNVATIGIRPTNGLTANTYTDTLTIRWDNDDGTGVIANLLFTVNLPTYTVSFNLNGGTQTGGGQTTQTITTGGSAIAPTVARAGFSFDGWNRDFSNVTENMTITAQWTQIITPVTNITDVPTAAGILSGFGDNLALTGTVQPSNATNRSITWSVVNANNTGAMVTGNTFRVTTGARNTVKIRATIPNGIDHGVDYTQDFNIFIADGVIRTPAQLLNIGGEGSAGKYYIVANNISVPSGYRPISDFRGTLDGLGNSITLPTRTINGNFASSGLFRDIYTGTVVIENLRLNAAGKVLSDSGVSKNSRAYTGGLIGRCMGNANITINNVHFDGTVEAVSMYCSTIGNDLSVLSIGSFIVSLIPGGALPAGIFDTIVGNINGFKSGSGSYSYAGGLIGYIDNSTNVTIVNSSASGHVTSTARKNNLAAFALINLSGHTRAFAGGLVGYKENGSTLKIGNSSVFNSVTINSDTALGNSSKGAVLGKGSYSQIAASTPNTHVSIKGYETNLLHKIDKDFVAFEDVYMNGILLSPDYYTVTSGSTVVTLLSSYLETLPVGTHTMTVNFSDGFSADEYILVIEPQQNIVVADEEEGYHFSQISKVYINGNLLIENTHYKLINSSEEIKFDEGFIRTLPKGIHTLRIVFTDGAFFEEQFEIDGEAGGTESPNPPGQGNTGDTWSTDGSGNSLPSTSVVPTKNPLSIPNWAKRFVTGTVRNSIVSANITTNMARNAIASVKDEGNGIAVQFNIASRTAYENMTVTIQRAALETLKAANVKYVRISTGIIDLTLDLKSVETILAKSTGNIVTVSAIKQITMPEEAQWLIGNRPLYDITIKCSDDISISDFGDGTIIIGLPYVSATGERTGGLYAVYLDDDGQPHQINNSSYNNGKVIFTRNHLSLYGVSYIAENSIFIDISGHWMKDAIDFAVSRGLINGVDQSSFLPNTAITRADFAIMLGRHAGVGTSEYTKSSFTDVANDHPAMPYIEWAIKNNIMQSKSVSIFSPDTAISRQEMAVMMVNYAMTTGITIPISRIYVSYADNSRIASWAREQVKAMQQAGIMVGKENNRFDPLSNVTRGEASVILRRYIELIIDNNTAQGWVQNDSGQRQYITPNGRFITGWQTIDGARYWFDRNGMMKTGWHSEGKRTYYIEPTGIMASGKWIKINDKWYYFNTNGFMAINTTIDGYDVGDDGARKE